MPVVPTSVNGWQVLQPTSPLLHTWVIPARTGEVRIKLRNGSAGFLLAHFLLWFAERVEPLHGGIVDDWGYALRPVRGSTTGYSNHASGCAADVNATKHPLGVAGTFSPGQTQRIRRRLRWLRVLAWGGNYTRRKDEMHFEVVQDLTTCERRARRLSKTPRGIRLLRANPGQRKVIYS
jgi:hypothetical protein